ncbi:MAG: hypothetical protein JWQ66_2110 [Mucilaginibacter sp.]|nr:hypothetical protein [Mucilaginibacter sp.]
MKPKSRFPGILLPFWKRLKLKLKPLTIGDNRELYYAVGLVLLWLLVFTLSHLKSLKLQK